MASFLSKYNGMFRERVLQVSSEEHNVQRVVELPKWVKTDLIIVEWETNCNTINPSQTVFPFRFSGIVLRKEMTVWDY